MRILYVEDNADLRETIGLLMERSEEHTSELQSPCNLVCRLLLEKKKKEIQRAAGIPVSWAHNLYSVMVTKLLLVAMRDPVAHRLLDDLVAYGVITLSITHSRPRV